MIYKNSCKINVNPDYTKLALRYVLNNDILIFILWHGFTNLQLVADKDNKRFLTIVLAVIAAIGLGAIGVAVWVAEHYKVIIKEKLPGIVMRSTDSLYTVSFDDISINVFTRRISVENVVIRYDTAQARVLCSRGMAPTHYYNINIPELEVSDIGWAELIGDKEVSFGNVLVNRPHVAIINAPYMNDSLRKPKKTAIRQISIDRIDIRHGNFIYKTVIGEDSSLFYINDGNITLNNFNFQPSAQRDTTRLAFSETVTATFGRFMFKTRSRLYDVRTSKIEFYSQGDSVNIEGLRISPPTDKNYFYRVTGHQADMFTLQFPSINISGFDWKKLSNNSVISINKIYLKDPVLSDYFSRVPHKNTMPKYGKFPNQLLQKWKQPVYIKYIFISNGTCNYIELNNTTKMLGHVNFSHIYGDLQNITNIDEKLHDNKSCLIRLRGKLYNVADIKATFNLSLTDKSGGFSVNGYMTNLNAEQINHTAQALALTEIRSLHVSHMDMLIQGNERHAAGSFKILYNDLKVKLQKMDEDSTRLKNRNFLSFFANAALIYKDNPASGEPPRTVKTQVVRNSTASFFNLIWSTIFDASIKTAVRSDYVVDMIQQKVEGAKDPGTNKPTDGYGQQAGQKERKGFFNWLFSKKHKKNKKAMADTAQ